MEQIFQNLFTWQLILFCLGIAAITYVIRYIVEYILDKPQVPASKQSKIWRDLFLPIIPVIIGALVGYLISSYPYPEGISSGGARVMFGLVAGLFSELVYRVVKGLFKEQIEKLKKTKDKE